MSHGSSVAPAGGAVRAASCLHELIADQVRLTPDAAAVISGDVALSYAELDERANRFAWHLTRSGVRPDTLVAVCAERGVDLILALLGVLKAGAANGLPPRQELAAMLTRHAVSHTIIPPAALLVTEPAPDILPGGAVAQALPAPRADRTSGATRPAPPSGAAEQALAGIWRSELGVAEVGAEGNFFALGGDSILAIRVVARAVRAGFKIKSKDLFQRPTSAALARSMSASRTAAQTETESRGRGTMADETMEGTPLTPIQRWLCERSPRPGSVAQYVVDPEVDHGAAGDLEGVIARAVERAASDLDVRRGPLLQAMLFSCGAVKRLVLVASHLVVGGISWRVLLEDLETACSQVVTDGRFDLGPAGRSFGDWARRLSAEAAAGRFNAELDFWQGLTAVPVGETPFDHAGANLVGGTNGDHPVEDRYPLTPMQGGILFDSLMGRQLDAYVIQFDSLLDRADGLDDARLDELARAWQAAVDGLTVNTVVQAAWALLLARYNGSADVCFGATVSGQAAELPGIESVTGLCISTLPVRVAVPDERNVISWLRELQEQQAEARAFDTVSLAEVQSWLHRPSGGRLFEPGTEPNISGHPEQPAYVMYTSGSTGVPKGVTATHRNVLEVVDEVAVFTTASRTMRHFPALRAADGPAADYPPLPYPRLARETARSQARFSRTYSGRDRWHVTTSTHRARMAHEAR